MLQAEDGHDTYGVSRQAQKQIGDFVALGKIGGTSFSQGHPSLFAKNAFLRGNTIERRRSLTLYLLATYENYFDGKDTFLIFAVCAIFRLRMGKVGYF